MGAKRAFELFPGGLERRIKGERKKRFAEEQRAALTAATAAAAAAPKVCSCTRQPWADALLQSSPKRMHAGQFHAGCVCRSHAAAQSCTEHTVVPIYANEI